MSDPGPLANVNRELKRYRNLPDEGMIKGVCAGLAYRLGVATWIVRVIFLLLLFGYGAGLLAYVLTAWLAPDGETPDDYDERTGMA